MTLENAKVLYKHRLELKKPVDDILARYPELSTTKPDKPEVEDGKKPKGRTK